MVTDTLPESSRRVIRAAGLTMIDVPHLTPAAGRHPGFDPSFVRLNDAWTKLRVFGLTQYDRLILIDSDMIFLRAMDELFDLQLPGKDWIGAAPACVCNPFKLAHYPEDWYAFAQLC
jgi:alpha-N-acetylglucosamine transferase